MKKFIILSVLCIITVALTITGACEEEENTEYANVEYSLSQDTVKPGDTLTVTVSLSNSPKLKQINVIPVYDHTLFEFVSAEWLRQDAVTAEFSIESSEGCLIYENETDCNGDIFSYVLKVKSDARATTSHIWGEVDLQKADYNVIHATYIQKTVKINGIPFTPETFIETEEPVFTDDGYDPEKSADGYTAPPAEESSSPESEPSDEAPDGDSQNQNAIVWVAVAVAVCLAAGLGLAAAKKK